MNDKNAVRAQLAERLEMLVARIGRIEGELTLPLSADSKEQANEIEDEDLLAAEDNIVLQEIASVRAAIGRIDAGHYGDCLSCGAAISPARLAALPEATLCTECM